MPEEELLMHVLQRINILGSLFEPQRRKVRKGHKENKAGVRASAFLFKNYIRNPA